MKCLLNLGDLTWLETNGLRRNKRFSEIKNNEYVKITANIMLAKFYRATCNEISIFYRKSR